MFAFVDALSSSASVVFMSSVVGVMGNSGHSADAASKAGLVGLAKSLAKELASRQLRVNVIAPGFIQTEMTGVLDESVKKSYMDNIPLGRFGRSSRSGSGRNFSALRYVALYNGTGLEHKMVACIFKELRF
jgi:NAD(P)-dependent dehydrogenase (short-subunit alcohol dehydrogenase family)